MQHASDSFSQRSLIPLIEHEHTLEPIEPTLIEEISDEMLCAGVQAVLSHLIPQKNMEIYRRRQEIGPIRTMQAFSQRMRNLLVFENLSNLEMGHMVNCIKSDELWRHLPGGANYSTFRQWVQASGYLPLTWQRVDELLRFYKLFFRCVESRISPAPLLAPSGISPYKLGIIKDQLENMDRQVEEWKTTLGEKSDLLATKLKEMRESIGEEMRRIAVADDMVLQQQESDRRYQPAKEDALQVLPIHIQAHLQKYVLVAEHAQIPLTRDALQAWKQRHTHIVVSLNNQQMTIEELEEYLEEHDLFVEAPIIDMHLEDDDPV